MLVTEEERALQDLNNRPFIRNSASSTQEILTLLTKVMEIPVTLAAPRN